MIWVLVLVQGRVQRRVHVIVVSSVVFVAVVLVWPVAVLSRLPSVWEAVAMVSGVRAAIPLAEIAVISEPLLRCPLIPPILNQHTTIT